MIPPWRRYPETLRQGPPIPAMNNLVWLMWHRWFVMQGCTAGKKNNGFLLRNQTSVDGFKDVWIRDCLGVQFLHIYIYILYIHTYGIIYRYYITYIYILCVHFLLSNNTLNEPNMCHFSYITKENQDKGPITWQIRDPPFHNLEVKKLTNRYPGWCRFHVNSCSKLFTPFMSMVSLFLSEYIWVLDAEVDHLIIPHHWLAPCTSWDGLQQIHWTSVYTWPDMQHVKLMRPFWVSC